MPLKNHLLISKSYLSRFSGKQIGLLYTLLPCYRNKSPTAETWQTCYLLYAQHKRFS
jgi:hypothetical protein